MTETLLHKPAIELLKLFGAGNHKPGSGSAAAFEGMLAAKLLMTVISVTKRPRYQPRYDIALPTLSSYYKEIEENIFPELYELFSKDSFEFDKAIQFRLARRKEKDLIEKNFLRRQEMEQMKVVIDIPMRIANHATTLCEMANYVFDNAFEDARGDSHVAFSGAVAALAGSLAIIRLNLLEFGTDDYKYCEIILRKLQDLDITYTNYNKLATSKITVLQREYDVKLPFYLELHDLIDNLKSNKIHSDEMIEAGISKLQKLIWKHRNLIWPDNPPQDYKDLLNPELILREVLGYDYVCREEFGVLDEKNNTKEIAGIIHQSNRLVVVSNKYPVPVQRFTAAHELAHALFHLDDTLHRDNLEDFAQSNGTKSKTEKEADRGAVFILMPRKFVIKEFTSRFGIPPFVIEENSTFNLTRGDITSLRNEVKTLRGLSKKLAVSESYNHIYFESLASFFNVSIEAMAIRLEELGLVKF
ncbi:cyclodeaminase/cyclohydrolase family protein [Flavobacterium sp. GCM10023249]|uniref:cyclodeaminase/cyclohydrolase family protein n=1 Tax=unclassified Flavobacterium TaxID=196869 RepID=UPI00360FEBC0